MASSSIIRTISLQCVEIIRDLEPIQRFLTIDSIILVLLDRYQLPAFEHLQVGSFMNIPILEYIFAMNKKIDQFLQLKVATTTLISIHDIYNELMLLLSSYNFIHLAVKIEELQLIPNQDKCELDIDDIDASDSQVLDGTLELNERKNMSNSYNKYDVYGLGCIYNHPLLLPYFNQKYGPYNSIPVDKTESMRPQSIVTLYRDIIEFYVLQNDHNDEYDITGREMHMVSNDSTGKKRETSNNKNSSNVVDLGQHAVKSKRDLCVFAQFLEFMANKYKQRDEFRANRPSAHAYNPLWELGIYLPPQHFLYLYDGLYQLDSLYSLKMKIDAHSNLGNVAAASWPDEIHLLRHILYARRKHLATLSKQAYEITDAVDTYLNPVMDCSRDLKSSDTSAKEAEDGNYVNRKRAKVDDLSSVPVSVPIPPVPSAIKAKALQTPYQFIPNTSLESLLTHPNVSIVPCGDLLDCMPCSQHSSINASDAQKELSIGRFGEALVYQYLMKHYCGKHPSDAWLDGQKDHKGPHNIDGKSRKHFTPCTVEWKNQSRESYAPYDLVLRAPSGYGPPSFNNTSASNPMKTHFIEVKATKYDQKSIFEFSLQEMEFMWNMSNRIVSVRKPMHDKEEHADVPGYAQGNAGNYMNIEKMGQEGVSGQYVSNSGPKNNLVSYDIYRVCNIPNYTLTGYQTKPKPTSVPESCKGSVDTRGTFIVVIQDVMTLLQDQKLKLHMSYY